MVSPLVRLHPHDSFRWQAMVTPNEVRSVIIVVFYPHLEVMFHHFAYNGVLCEEQVCDKLRMTCPVGLFIASDGLLSALTIQVDISCRLRLFISGLLLLEFLDFIESLHDAFLWHRLLSLYLFKLFINLMQQVISFPLLLRFFFFLCTFVCCLLLRIKLLQWVVHFYNVNTNVSEWAIELVPRGRLLRFSLLLHHLFLDGWYIRGVFGLKRLIIFSTCKSNVGCAC